MLWGKQNFTLKKLKNKFKKTANKGKKREKTNPSLLKKTHLYGENRKKNTLKISSFSTQFS